MVAGRARAVVVGVGANTAMGSIRDSMLQTEDVSIIYVEIWLVICICRVCLLLVYFVLTCISYSFLFLHNTVSQIFPVIFLLPFCCRRRKAGTCRDMGPSYFFASKRAVYKILTMIEYF